MNQFTLCHRVSKYSRDWTCKDGFQSVHYADLEAFALKYENANIETRLFPFNKYTPKIIQICMIKWDLSTFDIPPIKYT
jgi:hypothetical protein